MIELHRKGKKSRPDNADIDLQYLLTTPPNAQVWHKAFFMVGPGEWP